MLDREACERRVYRLATLLTGDPEAATAVIEAVVGAQPDLRRLDNAHMDRLTVLRSREIDPSIPAGEGVPAQAASALASLAPQPREAWVFSRVYGLPMREMARAMDCSTTALGRHLELASQAMNEALAEKAEQAASSLLRYSLSLDVPPFYRARIRRRRRIRVALRLAGGIAALALLSAAFWLVGRAFIQAGP